MTNDSRLIAAAFHELGQFCRDVALLLRTSDEIFNRSRWVSAQYNYSIYSGSTSLDWPNTGYRCDSSARTAIRNWTGFLPLLLSSLICPKAVSLKKELRF